MYVQTCMHAYTHMYVCLYAGRMYAGMCVCVYVYIYIYICNLTALVEGPAWCFIEG